MAFKKTKEATDYSGLLNELKTKGPDRLYMLWGEEDYLRESFFQELKKLCVEGAADFNHHRLDGEALDYQELQEAVNSVPFMGERILIELRNFAVNECKEDNAEHLKDILSDIPEYATVALILPTNYEPDGRLTLIKNLKKLGRAIEFTPQPQGLLINWVKRRFASMGKEIGRQECERLIFISGSRMTGLIPEIEKIGSFAKGDTVSLQDIDALAQHIPEAKVFEMTDCLAKRRYDAAAGLLAELLQSGEHPIKTLAMIGFQMRRLYTARLAIDEKLGREFVMQTHSISSGNTADMLMESASGFSLEELMTAVENCAEADFLMKSSSQDDEEILEDLLLKFAVGGSL